LVKETVVAADELKRQELLADRPPLDEIVNLHDFEVGFAVPF
jgi:hypothetical protein